jgi:hypothetical protein
MRWNSYVNGYVCSSTGNRPKKSGFSPWERVEAAHIELIEIEVMLWSPA